ncbi:MAG: hypothetical protein U0526_02275 [Candidatus Saccharibacteria bacterium]
MKKLNLNMKLSGDIGSMLKPILKYAGVIAVLVVGGLIAYTAFFVTNLFYSNGDLSKLEEKQSESSQQKQIRFNQKTLDSLKTLTPADSQPNTADVGKQNPFSPNN